MFCYFNRLFVDVQCVLPNKSVSINIFTGVTEMAPKIKVKERITDGEIDLSMSDLDDVPVKEIV